MPVRFSFRFKQAAIHSILFLGFVHTIVAQNDSLVLSNGNSLVGEIISMENSVLVMKTPFSKSDFNIKWKEVARIYTTNLYLITLDNGNWYNSNLQSGDGDEIYILGDDGSPLQTSINEIVYLKELKQGIWSRINANVDIGLNLTKANNQRQFNYSLRLDYLNPSFGTDIYFENYQTRQDNVDPINRREGGFNFRYFLDDDWYIVPQIGFLANTEQALQSRISPTLGGGRFLTRNNQFYWGVLGGLTMNIEQFTNETEDRQSAEMFVGTAANFFDFGDMNLLANVVVYPSITEKGRVRTDAKLSMKYDFFDDFYIKFNTTYNYDNQPAISGNESDYVFGVSFGWEKD